MKQKCLLFTLIILNTASVLGQSFHVKDKKKAFPSSISPHEIDHISELKFDDKTNFFLKLKIDPSRSKGIDSSKTMKDFLTNNFDYTNEEIIDKVYYEDNSPKVSEEQKTTQLGFGGGDLNGQIYAELINDYFISKKGNYIGSLIFGSVVSNSDSSKALNNFFNGGGNFFLKYSFVKDFGKEDGNFTLRNILSLRSSANLPKSKDVKEPITNLNFESSEEFILGLATVNDKIEILLNSKVAIAAGNQDFTKELFEVNNNKKYPKAFVYFQMNLGLRITDKYLINVGFKPIVSGNLNENFSSRKWNTIGFQLLF